MYSEAEITAVVNNSNKLELSDIQKDTKVEITFSPEQYNVTYNTDGGSITNQADYEKYSYGKGLTLPDATATTKKGHTFVGWYDNENKEFSSVLAISKTDTGAKTFWAKWAPNTYSIVLNTNGGTVSVPEVFDSYVYGDAFMLPDRDKGEISKSGYIFKGWYDNAEFSGYPVDRVADTAIDTQNFWAKWVPVMTVSAGITGDVIGGDISPRGSAIVGQGDSITFHFRAVSNRFVIKEVRINGVADPAAKLAGSYTFNNVQDNSNSIEVEIEGAKYDLTLHTNSGKDIKRQYTYNRDYSLPGSDTVKKAGYIFAGWYDNWELSGDPVIRIARGEHGAKELWAKWTLRPADPVMQNPEGVGGAGRDNPKTGTGSQPLMYGGIMAVSLTAVSLTAYKMHKDRDDR